MTGESAAPWSGLARFGPFFAVDLDPDVTWRPLDDLSRASVLRQRAAAVAAALGAGLPADQRVPVRVAASVSQLGLCARLSAVALGALLDGLAVPAPDRWSYLDQLGGPYPVGVRPEPTAQPPSWPDLGLALVRPIARATIATFALSPQVVWGNVASGLAGAAKMITLADPAVAERAEELLDEVLAYAELRGTMISDGSGGRRRRSCCLIYQVSGSTSAICGDCVLGD